MNIFNDIDKKQELLKTRYFFICACICSPIFFYFMHNIATGSTDSVAARIFLSVASLAGLFYTYTKSPSEKVTYAIYTLVRIVYLALYFYMMLSNEWSVFHRWSYFVVGAIFCGCAVSWYDFLFVATVSLVAPIIAGFFSPLTPLEIIHFHAANLAVFGIIGMPIRSHWIFKNELNELTKGIVEKSQLSVLGEMASGISHEINSPLMIFQFSLDQLQRQLEQPVPNKDKVNDLIEKMYRMTGRITEIVRSLKSFSREKNNEEVVETDLVKVVEESINLCNRKFIEAGITLNKRIPNKEIICSVKKFQIMHACMNIYNNAFEASLRGEGTPEVTIEIEERNGFAYLSVTDNGPGVSKEIADKIMLPFFTTKETGKGVGLGLSVSLGIATAHKGELYLDRSITNSTFVLKLPLSKKSQAA